MTEKVVFFPTLTVLSIGWVVIDGTVEAGTTVRVAALLVVLPLASVTTTANRAPLSAIVVAGVAYL